MTQKGEHRVVVELDEETHGHLAALGDPAVVLARLARAAAAGATGDAAPPPGQPRRDVTDESLRAERHTADESVRAERHTADDLRVQENGTSTPAHDHEGAERRRERKTSLDSDRQATDRGLSGERGDADIVLVDQREANEQLVRATLRAHDLADEAASAREQAEAGARDLRTVAEFRDMFMGIVSHDLRNPLGSILMAAGLLTQGDRLAPHDAQLVARIVRSAQRISRMITQLLDLTRVRLGGGMPIDVAPCDLGAVCRAAVEELPPRIHLAIEGDLSGTWDADRLAEVVSNLAGNAVHHALPGTDVHVMARADEAGVVVEVRNQGAPIPPELVPHIFEPFRQGGQRLRSPAGNLGLGLYIAHAIVVAHGGTVAASSADGTTTFTVRLPRSSCPPPPA